MLSREEALNLLREHGSEPHLINHAVQSEAVMRGLAARLGRDETLWGLTGLLHDLDYPATKEDGARHGLETARLLEDRLPEEALAAIRAHGCEMNGCPPQSELDYALRCAETVTGLVSAAALVRPDRMVGMQPKSLKKKMKDKAFAAAVNRAAILECERVGLPLDEFLSIAIDSVAGVAAETGLS